MSSVQESVTISKPMETITKVGIVGGGQLALMMIEAAKKLRLEIAIQTPHKSDPAVQGNPKSTVFAAVDNVKATEKLAQECEVITFENEFVDLPGLKQLEADQNNIRFYPSLSVLEKLLDKYKQREFLASINLNTPKFAIIKPRQESGFSHAVIKSRRHGYDGQGTFIQNTQEDIQKFWQGFDLDQEDIDDRFMVEDFVPFEKELAIMAARSTNGEVALYPVVETYQKNQVCRWAMTPVDLELEIRNRINKIATKLLQELDAVGIFGIELFLTPDKQVLVNEIAPRTHNSGHLTIEACKTSQFEQHLRAVCGLTLGDSALRQEVAGAVMVNLLGFETTQSDYSEKRQQLANFPNAKVHWYGKAEAKPGRKLGHVTVLLESADRESAIAVAQQIESIWYQDG
jgi:5-(carboxyamino)imidazole ribonucleotide synthase